MKYENAHKGVIKLFYAEIFLILAALSELFEMIPDVGQTIASFAVAIFAVLNFAFELIGLRKAAKDCPHIKTAFRFVLFTLLFSLTCGVIIVIIPDYSWLRELGELVTFVINLFVTYNVLYGLSVLEPTLAEKAKKTWRIYMILIGVEMLSTVVSVVLAGYGIFSVVYALYILFILFDYIFSLVAYFKYMGFLKFAKSMV